MAMIETVASRTTSVSFLISTFNVTFPLLPATTQFTKKISGQIPVRKTKFPTTNTPFGLLTGDGIRRIGYAFKAP